MPVTDIIRALRIVARGLQGYIVGKIAWSFGRKGNSIVSNLLATIASIPGNMVLNVVGVVIANPVCVLLNKVTVFN